MDQPIVAPSLSCVALDPSTSIGLGHLMRMACLRKSLRVPTVMLGEVEANVTENGLVTQHRAPMEVSADTRVVVVDRNLIGPDVSRWRLRRAGNRVVWIKRGGVTTSQAAIQSGFVAFADVIVVPRDIVAGSDVVDSLAANRGKLREIQACHAYQVVAPSTNPVAARVFMSLGAFEAAQRDKFIEIRDEAVRAGIPFIWAAYDDTPLSYGFAAEARVRQSEALLRKSESSAIVSEGGYNSVHEALHLRRPALFVANDGNGREQQSHRVAAARQRSHLIFDAARRGDIAKWIEATQSGLLALTDDGTRHDAFPNPGTGFAEMARIVEEVASSN